MIFSNNYRIKISNKLLFRRTNNILKLYDIIVGSSWHVNDNSVYYSVDDIYDNLIDVGLDINDTLIGSYDVTITDNIQTPIISDFYDNLVSYDVDIMDDIIGDYDISLKDTLDDVFSVDVLLYDIEGDNFIIDDNDIIQPEFYMLNDNGGYDFVIYDNSGMVIVDDK